MQQFPKIYNKLISLCFQRKLLGRQHSKSLEYYHRYISNRTPNQNIRKSNTPTLPTIRYNAQSSKSLDSDNEVQDTQNSSHKRDLTPVDRAISRFLSRNQSSLNRSRSSSTSKQSKRGKLAPKPSILDKEDKKLIEHFKSIAGNSQDKPLKYIKLTAGAMHAYLIKRYPRYMVDVMIRYIDFKQKLSFEQFCNQMDRIIDG
jgi:hypothetical protein